MAAHCCLATFLDAISKAKMHWSNILEDCRRMEIDVLPPGRESARIVDFKVRSMTKSCFGHERHQRPAAAARQLRLSVARKNETARFKDLFDFCERVDPQSCNRSTIESADQGGSFGYSLTSQAGAVVWRCSIGRMQSGASAAAADRRSGQKGLFEEVEDEADELIGSVRPA